MTRPASPTSSSIRLAHNARLTIGLALLACVLAFQLAMALPRLL